MKESEFLHLGDPVWWKGGFGDKEARLAEVSVIEARCDMHFNQGTPVERLSWRKVTRFVPVKCSEGEELAPAVVTLSNGHWAYGWQLWPVKMWAKSYDKEI